MKKQSKPKKQAKQLNKSDLLKILGYIDSFRCTVYTLLVSILVIQFAIFLTVIK